MFPLAGAMRTVRSGLTKVRSELRSDSEFGVLGRSSGSKCGLELRGVTVGSAREPVIS